MKITEMTYLSRRKTAEYSWDEFTATAVVDENEDWQELSTKLKDFVVGTLTGAKVSTTLKQKPAAPKAADVQPKKVEEKTEENLSPQQKAARTRKANKIAAKKAAKVEEAKEEVPEVIPSIEEVQTSLRGVAQHYQNAAKAVAIIEMVAGVKTMAEVSPDKYKTIIDQCSAVVSQ